MIREQETIQENRATQLRSADNESDASPLKRPFVLVPIPVPVPSQAKNQLYNGDLSHSVNTWFDETPSAGDMNKECAYFFSNDEPVLGQVLSPLNSFDTPGGANQTLKTVSHSMYSADYAEWSSEDGTGHFGGTASLDLLLPGRFIIPARAEYVSFIIARKDKYTVFPVGCYLYAGFWVNDGANSYWIQGANPFSLTANVSGTVSTPRELRYRIYARTDRARSFLSSEEIELSAPSDADFVAGARVQLSWQPLADLGILSYDVYRYDPAATQYLLLEQVESGTTTYTDNNSRENVTVTGYPTATDDRSIALTTTRTVGDNSILNELAVDGVDASWTTYAMPIFPPSDYDTAVGTEQWLRLGVGGLTGEAPDLKLPVEITGGTSVLSDLGLFNVGQVGLTVSLTDEDGNVTTNEITGFTDENNIALDSAVPDGSYTILIEGGGDQHSLYIDLIHASFGSGAIFGYNDQDFTPPRPQYPVATPNGSSQGGIGVPGSGGDDGGDGGPRCVYVEQPILTLYGNQTMSKRIGDIQFGDVVESANHTPNVVIKEQTSWCPELWKLVTENGCSIIASPSEPIIQNRLDTHGKPISQFHIGDTVRTCREMAFENSKVKEVGLAGFAGNVKKLSLAPGRLFVAGECETGMGGVVIHNAKPVLPDSPY